MRWGCQSKNVNNDKIERQVIDDVSVISRFLPLISKLSKLKSIYDPTSVIRSPHISQKNSESWLLEADKALKTEFVVSGFAGPVADESTFSFKKHKEDYFRTTKHSLMQNL